MSVMQKTKREPTIIPPPPTPCSFKELLQRLNHHNCIDRSYEFLEQLEHNLLKPVNSKIVNFVYESASTTTKNIKEYIVSISRDELQQHKPDILKYLLPWLLKISNFQVKACCFLEIEIGRASCRERV